MTGASRSTLSSSLTVQGFHLTYTTHVRTHSPSPHANCSLHLLHVLPSSVYADPYELAQRPGFSSSLRGTADLELPVAAVAANGSSLLLDVDLPEDGDGDGAVIEVEVPLHARYGHPVRGDGPAYRKIALDPPTGFWACPVPDAQVPPELAAHVPSDRFESSRISLIPRTPDTRVAELVIPVGNLADLAFVDVGTTAVMLLCFAYLAFVSFRTAHRLRATSSAHKSE